MLWSKDREVEVTFRRLCKTRMWRSVEGAASNRTAEELEGVREAEAEEVQQNLNIKKAASA